MKTTEKSKENTNLKAFLWDVPAEKNFYCTDGSTYRNLEDLDKALTTISNEAFHYHVNEQKNDFANWIYDVVGDVELANTLRPIKDKKKIIPKVHARVLQIKKQEEVLD